MSGLKYWANESGRNAVSVLLVGFGLLLMVVTRILLPRFSTFAIVIGACFIATGAVRLIAGHRHDRH